MTGAGRRSLRLERRYPLPEVRLRFRSTEMAVLRNARGEELLATAAFSNISHYLVLLSARGDVIRLVPDANVGWAMRADEKGKLISGGKDLTVYDPDTGAFEVLAKQPVAPEELWGACVTRRLVVMGSSDPKGTVAVYDRAERRIVRSFYPSPLHTPVTAPNTYDIIEAPDGRILVMSCGNRAVIGVLDPDDLSLIPARCEALADSYRVTGGLMLDERTLFVLTENGAVLLGYPGFETLAKVPSPKDVSFGFKACAHAGSAAAWGANRPWLLDRDCLEWRALTDEPVGDPHPECPETCVALAGLADGSLVGVTDGTCTFWRLERGNSVPLRKTLDIRALTDGAPLAIGGGRAYGSSHAMQRFWSVDLETGAGRDLGQCSLGGQANAMVWDPDRHALFLGTYPECRIRKFEPDRPPAFPDNPGTFAAIGPGLHRVRHTMLRIGDDLWTTIDGSGPAGLSGALVRVGLATREVEIFREAFTKETPLDIVLGPDRRTLYMGARARAECAPDDPAFRGAQLAAFDLGRKEFVRRERPVPGALTLSALATDLQGRLLFIDGPVLTTGRALWAWDLPTGEFARIGAAPDGLREILRSPGGDELWATAFRGVGSLELGDPCRIDLSRGYALDGNDWDQKMCKHLQWDAADPEVLWCVQFTEILRLRLSKERDS